MALQKAKQTDIPADAVLLSEQEAVEYQLKLVKDWEDQSDVFAIKYGVPILSCATATVGIYFNYFYRRKFKLGHFGSFSTYLPTVAIPTALSALLHFQVVLPDVVLFKGNCPVCLEIRAASIQSLSGCVLPLMLANVGSIGIAAKYCTYNIPYVTQEPMKVLKLMQSVTKPLSNILMAVFLGQALLASAVTYYETKSVYTVQKKLLARELQLEDS